MAVPRRANAGKAKIAINARSVDTKRVLRIDSGAEAEAFGRLDATSAPEWRQFTLGRLLLFVFGAYERRILENQRAAGFPEVRQVHFAVMRHIDISAGTRIGDLATRAGVTKAAMGHVVAEIERLGLVKTSADPADARARRVELSKRGHKLMEVTRQSSARIEAEFEKQIGTTAFAALRNGLIALRETMS